jgi:hypothetical protein
MMKAPTQEALCTYWKAKVLKQNQITIIHSIPKNNVLWASRLDNTHGVLQSKNFVLSKNIANKQLKFIVYIITVGPGRHFLKLARAGIE